MRRELIALLNGLWACFGDNVWDAHTHAESCGVVELPATDGGPWPCNEPGCPAALVSCEMLVEYCESTFSDVWERPPTGLDAVEIASQCRKACGRSGVNASEIDATIDLRYLHGIITEDEAARLIGFCDSGPQRWRPSLTRARQTERDDIEKQAGRTSESCMLIFSQFYAAKRELVAARSPAVLPELVRWIVATTPPLTVKAATSAA